MILLDTNVLSEALKPAPNHPVIVWLDTQAADTLFISSVTIAELKFGVGVMPEGKRKDKLKIALEDIINLFEPRILPFDTRAAKLYAELAVKAREAGKGFPTPDGYIASIAAAHKFSVASRDTSAFKAANLTVINPWSLNS